uniref:DUF4158 domain-containing protein n=1 Tax=Rhodococcus opacus TaxID=37919 RepID=UPI0027DD93E2|nr:DUF4158 domain-containing protein [Rhodococcus opacus]
MQVLTVRHLGMFLPDPLDVPPELVDCLAAQLGIDDPSCVKRYTDRPGALVRARAGDPTGVWDLRLRRGGVRGAEKRPPFPNALVPGRGLARTPSVDAPQRRH